MGESNYGLGILVASCLLLVVGIVLTALEINEYKEGASAGMPASVSPSPSESEAPAPDGTETAPATEAAPETEELPLELPSVDVPDAGKTKPEEKKPEAGEVLDLP